MVRGDFVEAYPHHQTQLLLTFMKFLLDEIVRVH